MDLDGRHVDRFNKGLGMIPHVKGCRCETCLEGRTVQHVAGCLCDGCKAREDAYRIKDRVWDAISRESLLRSLGDRVGRFIRAVDAAKDVMTAQERDALIKFLRRRP